MNHCLGTTKTIIITLHNGDVALNSSMPTVTNKKRKIVLQNVY